MKKYCFDLDNTLCETSNGDYDNSKPIIEAVNAVNRLYDKRHYIIIYTARMMGKCDGNISKVYESVYELTKNQLNNWGLRYNELILGKPEFDILIDDKSINYDKFWYKKIT